MIHIETFPWPSLDQVKSEKAKFKRLQTKLTEKEGQLTASGDTLRELKETLQTREEANGEEVRTVLLIIERVLSK